MKLEEILLEASRTGRRIIVVENSAGSVGYKAKVERLREQTEEAFGTPLDIEAKTLEQFRDLVVSGLDGFSSATVLYQFGGGYAINLEETMRDFRIAEALFARFPGMDLRLMSPFFSPTAIAVLDKVARYHGVPLDDKLKESFTEADSTNETVLGSIEARLGSIKHRFGSTRDARFLEQLSQAFAQGCNQTASEKTFLYLGDRIKRNCGRFEVMHQSEDFSGIDLSRYHAIFIDNDWDDDANPKGHIGRGIECLRRISELTRARGVNIPIIYQTAHSLDDLTDEEKARIGSFPSTYLVPKNLAPKVSRSEQVARKELVMSDLVHRNERVSRHFTRTVPIGAQGFVEANGRYITWSKPARVSEEKDEYKAHVLTEAEIEDSPLVHKMYVLASMHTDLKAEVDNASLSRTEETFKDFDEISSRVSKLSPDLASRVEALRASYQEIVRTERRNAPTTIIHNDPKWDNWYANSVLLDFGSAVAGREYFDLAAALLNPSNEFKSALDRNSVDRAVESYIRVRKALDKKFNVNEAEFRTSVYSALVVQSLRYAFHKAELHPDIATGLVRVAETYANFSREKN